MPLCGWQPIRIALVERQGIPWIAALQSLLSDDETLVVASRL